MTVDPFETLSGDLVRIHDEYFIRASSALADARTRVLKHGETFAVFDRHGDFHPVGRGEQGLYHEGTRFLSRLELRIDGERPILLSSTVTEDNAEATADLTNPPLALGGGRVLLQDQVHLLRTSALSEATGHQCLRVHSYAQEPLELRLGLLFGADFADVFEVRGIERKERGTLLPAEPGKERVVLGYRGLDGLLRRTLLAFHPTPVVLEGGTARFLLRLEPGEEAAIELSVQCLVGSASARVPPSYLQASGAAHAALLPSERTCRVETSNEQCNDWLNRAVADLRMMETRTPWGPYLYAGVPWYSTPFGRDALLTALEVLWLDPGLAAGVLRYLAATQATAEDPSSEGEPGKILHEARSGEMAALGEVPFRRYYGTVDATPLFVLLASAYFERTADRALLEELWPAVERALAWIELCGARSPDGFLSYERRTAHGLVNQGWKDSQDSVFHADGTLARGPIALCEVQAYAYGALVGGAVLAEALGEPRRAQELRIRAERLRARFEERFWLEELGTYAIALDGQGRPCALRSSNAGQCLLTGIAGFERAARVAETLMTEALFSGWGIRTLARGEQRYNPMSYHNGSIWPHDNALIAAGLARYGLKEPVLRILTGLFDATLFLDLNRLPELFCGFPRRAREGPTLYPVACAPQAWASGSVALLLQACLGLQVSAVERRVLFQAPTLPPFLEQVRLRGLRVGEAIVDLDLHRHPDDVGIQVVHREGTVDVVTVK